MVNKIIAASALLALTLFVVIAATNTGNGLTGNVVALSDTSQSQKAVVSFQNYAYVLEPSTFKVGVPVELTVDLSTVFGCMRDIRIPAFEVSEYVTQENNVIKFTPTKTGTFNIMCSMNMGRGTFSVVDQTGVASDFVEVVPAQGSCGQEGGCGGCSY